MKIILSENDSESIKNLAESGSKGYTVIKNLFQDVLSDLNAISNIDPKGNVGLQTCSRQEAYKYLLDVAEIIFPDQGFKPKEIKTVDNTLSKWR